MDISFWIGLFKRAFLASLDSIGQTPKTLAFWLTAVVLAVLLVLRRDGWKSLKENWRRKTIESVLIPVIAWAPFFFWNLGYIQKDVEAQNAKPEVVAAPPSTAKPVREAYDSLRRRTRRLADEYYKYARKRLEDHPPNAYPDSSDPNPFEERKKMIQACQKYDRETEDYYLRHFKDRMVGIIREYNAKGVKTGYLESSLAQRPPGFTLPGSGWEGSQLDELSRFRELAYHVDARDHLIVLD